MTSILDFFKPVRKDKRPREENTEDSTQEVFSHAVSTLPQSSLEVNHKPRINSANETPLKAKTVSISSDSKPCTKRQSIGNSVSIGQSATTREANEESHGLSEYEKKRRTKMAANAKFLAELGMTSTQLKMTRQLQRKTPQAKKKIQSRKRPEEAQPVRRSSRLRGEILTQQPIEVAQESGNLDEPKDFAVEETFAKSSVFRYSVTANEVVQKAIPTFTGDSSRRELMGFHLDPNAYLTDHELKKTYSISFTSFHESGLVAAGGTNGRVAIFPFSNSYHREIVNTLDDPDAHTPLMTFKAHSGWISAVSLAKSVQGKENLLLTASNDGSVKLWDLNQSSAMLRTPKEIFASTNLHHKGVFGLDVCNDSVLTCSKDATIVLSRFCPNTGLLLVDQRFEDHEGVVKCVRFSTHNHQVFASGGNDRKLRVYDARLASNSVVTSIPNVHIRAINSVQFHPTDDNLLLSAGFDPNFYIFDLRKPETPACTFLKPPQSKDDSKAIFHPIFVRNGQDVVAARGHDLSLYRTNDGAAVSCGYIEDAASCIAADPFQDRIAIAQGGKLQFADAQWDYKTV